MASAYVPGHQNLDPFQHFRGGLLKVYIHEHLDDPSNFAASDCPFLTMLLILVEKNEIRRPETFACSVASEFPSISASDENCSSGVSQMVSCLKY